MPPELRQASQTGERLLQLLAQGDFAAAEQHIAPTARAQYNAITLKQRWDTLKTHTGTLRRIQPKRAYLELQGLQSWASLEYELLGDRAGVRVRMEAEKQGDTIYIRRVEFVF